MNQYYYVLLKVYMGVSFIACSYTLYEIFTKYRKEIDDFYESNHLVNSVLSRSACNVVAYIAIFVIIPLLPIFEIKRLLFKK